MFDKKNSVAIYRRENYGQTQWYIVDDEVAGAVRGLTGTKTLTDHARESLVRLGFRFHEVINPN